MLRIDFVGGTIVKIKFWLSIINGKYKDPGEFRGGSLGKKINMTPINDDH